MMRSLDKNPGVESDMVLEASAGELMMSPICEVGKGFTTDFNVCFPSILQFRVSTEPLQYVHLPQL